MQDYIVLCNEFNGVHTGLRQCERSGQSENLDGVQIDGCEEFPAGKEGIYYEYEYK